MSATTCPACGQHLPRDASSPTRRGRPPSALRLELESLSEVGSSWSGRFATRDVVDQCARRVADANGWKLSVHVERETSKGVSVKVTRVA